MIRPSTTWYGLARSSAAVLERPRLALGAVAHEVAAGAGLAGDAGPLPTGREPAAAPSAQPGDGDHLDGGSGSEPLGRLDAQAAGFGGEVRVERGDRRVRQQERGHWHSSVGRSAMPLAPKYISSR